MRKIYSWYGFFENFLLDLLLELFSWRVYLSQELFGLKSKQTSHQSPNAEANDTFRVPKELISRFVKLCPTCQARRGSNSQASPTTLSKNTSSLYSPPQSPETISPPTSRRESLLSRHSSMFSSSPVSTNIYGSQCHGNQWLSSPQHIHNPVAVHLGPPTAMTSSSSTASVGQNGLPSSYASSGIQNGGVGSRGSYLNGCETACNYPQHHHY